MLRKERKEKDWELGQAREEKAEEAKRERKNENPVNVEEQVLCLTSRKPIDWLVATPIYI